MSCWTQDLLTFTLAELEKRIKLGLVMAPPDQNIEAFTHCVFVKIIEDSSYFSKTSFISHLTFLSKCCSIKSTF